MGKIYAVGAEVDFMGHKKCAVELVVANDERGAVAQAKAEFVLRESDYGWWSYDCNDTVFLYESPEDRDAARRENDHRFAVGRCRFYEAHEIPCEIVRDHIFRHGETRLEPSISPPRQSPYFVCGERVYL